MRECFGGLVREYSNAFSNLEWNRFNLVLRVVVVML
jgi:hypothetical protein